MSDSIWQRLRWLIAGIFGLSMMGICFSVTSQVADDAFKPEQNNSAYIVSKSRRMVEVYQKEHGVLPADLSTVWSDVRASPVSDGWNRPLLYSIQNGRALIESLGRDGVRGGVGLDADISSTRFESRFTEKMPLSQKLAHPTGRLFAGSALACGLSVGFLVLNSLPKTPDPKTSWPLFAARLMGTLLGMSAMAFVGAMFIAIAHIPSGH